MLNKFMKGMFSHNFNSGDKLSKEIMSGYLLGEFIRDLYVSD